MVQLGDSIIVKKVYPLVTVGIPTYNRPKLLKEAMTSVLNQDYPNIELIVADNCSPESYEVDVVVDSFRKKIKNLVYIKREENVGAIKNNLRIRDTASGEFFMWLADDDTITSNYVSSCVEKLMCNPDAVCVMGNYVQLVDKDTKNFVDTSFFPQDSAFKRAVRFIIGSDDGFYYGLHRLDVLKRASIPCYWSIIRDSIQHNAYLLCMDVVLSGKVLLVDDKSVQWLQKHYSQKNYYEHESFLEVVFKVFLIRVNAQFIYWRKIKYHLGLRYVFPVFCLSFFALVKELGFIFIGRSPGCVGDSLVKKFLNRHKSRGAWFRDKRI